MFDSEGLYENAPQVSIFYVNSGLITRKQFGLLGFIIRCYPFFHLVTYWNTIDISGPVNSQRHDSLPNVHTALVFKSTCPDRTTAENSPATHHREKIKPTFPGFIRCPDPREKKIPPSALLLDGLYLRAADKIGPTIRGNRKKIQSGIGPSFRDMVNIRRGQIFR